MAGRLTSRLFNRLWPSKPPSAPAAQPGSTVPFASDLVDPSVMDQIGHLEILSRGVVDGLLAGKHRSTHKGGCCEFAQHRAYAPGDEIRMIDWQVYARNDRYFVRQYEEETNLQACLAIDTSGSMKFGMSTVSKLDYARRAAACLARLLLHQRDAVGAAILNEKSPAFVPPRQNASHLQAILLALQNATAGHSGSLASQIRSCIPRLRRRGMFVLFSDCFCELQELGNALRVVRARGHDVLVFQVLAPEEVHFKFRHWSSFESLETANHRINLDPAGVRDKYLKRFRTFLEQLEEMVTGIGADYVRVTTNHDLAESLAYFLRRRAASGGPLANNSDRVVTL